MSTTAELTGELIISHLPARAGPVPMTTPINEQAIDAATAATSGATTTNTVHDQMTIQQQNNLLFQQLVGQQNQLFTQTMQQQNQIFAQTLAALNSQTTAGKQADLIGTMVLSGSIVILP